MSNTITRLSILICTHNRESLLKRVLESIQMAYRPSGSWQVEILVIANACSDGTSKLLENIRKSSLEDTKQIPVDWLEEPRPGKSFALNTAIAKVRQSDLVAFVDDDHRVDHHYLVEICKAGEAHPGISMFCGRILPDWDGSEPAWVHDEGPYRIRPLPIPRSDSGPLSRELTANDPTPGGGNLFVRGRLFDRVGDFPTDLGPRGHDLGGGEDSAFVERAFSLGERLVYIPGVLQHHYVDPERLRFRYILRKAYRRAKTTAISKTNRQGVPLYQWRKLGGYLTHLLFSLSATQWRFYLVRISTVLGEMAGQRTSCWRPDIRPAEKQRNRLYLATMVLLALTGTSTGILTPDTRFFTGLGATFAMATLFTFGLAIKSLVDFTYTGPRLPREILTHYRNHIVLAFLRLLGFAFLILLVLATPGVVSYYSLAEIKDFAPRFITAGIAAGLSIVILTSLQFSRHLLLLPASIAASYNYRLSRLYPLWHRLSKARLKNAVLLCLGIPLTLAVAAGITTFVNGHIYAGIVFTTAVLVFILLFLWLRPLEAKPVNGRPNKLPNIIMIGSDTLRADRVNGSYPHEVAPFLRSLARKGVYLNQCFVPVARTAPSLLSLLTGHWPYRFSVRDNFVPDETTRLAVTSLPKALKKLGYYTAALSDWCGADMGKFDLGFDYTDVPEDQWNIKLFIRQGPKDLRLFVSLFARNRFGRTFLPEIYYLGGVPQTHELGTESRHLINSLAEREEPFFLNVFFSTTHGPFGSEYPYYLRYTDSAYEGDSKFVMARISDPWEIIRRQAEPKEAFDLEQILHLYDGCVTRFDDEVRKIYQHLEKCGLAERTIVVIYTDHGMEFFEHHTWGQGNSAISDVSSKIPVIIKGPGIPALQIDEPTRSIDLPATLLELIGAPSEALLGMDGASLTERFKPTPGCPDSTLLCETGIWLTDLPGIPENHLRYPNLIDLLTVRNLESGTISLKPEYEPLVIAAKDRWVRRGRWKLVYIPLIDGYRLKLFDTEADPGCTRDLSETHPLIVEILWRAMKQWLDSDMSAHESKMERSQS